MQRPPPQWLSQIKALCFDLGGTLFEHLPAVSTEANLQALVHSELGRPLNRTELDRYHQIRREAEVQFVQRPFFLHKDLVCASYQGFCAELFGTEQRREQGVETFFAAQRDSVTTQLRLREDVPALLVALRAQGLQLGIVSNIDEDYLQPLLQRTRSLEHMHWVLSSEAARSCKPDARIYELALARLDCPPEAVLFVGDSLVNDVQGPARHGMRTCWLTADQTCDAQTTTGADLQIERLGQLQELWS